MSTKYIHFTKEQKQIARQTDIAELLRSQGEVLKRSGKEYEWRDGSQKVTVRGNLWYHQYEQVGGDAIDFVRRYYNKSYAESVEYLLGGQLEAAPNSRDEFVQNNSYTPAHGTERKTEFKLPKAGDNMRRVYAYLLNRRGIDRDVLNAFVHQKMIYESADYHNAVFVGYDENGIARHAHKRGTGSESTYKGNVESCDPRYSFHWTGTDNTLYFFEAPIDMLSFISLHKDNWYSHSYAAACGVGDQVLFQMMKTNPNIDTVYLCLDNDEAGQAANKRISDKLLMQGIHHEILIPTRKDWNENLLFIEQEEEPCQALQL